MKKYFDILDDKHRILKEPINVGVFGQRGQGKSLYAYYFVSQLHKKGMTIFHNNLLPPGVPRTHGIDFKYFAGEIPDFMNNAILWIDEVQNYASPKRSLTTFQQYFHNFIIQQRKLNLSMIYTTQKPEDIAWFLEQQTDWEIHVKKLVPPENQKIMHLQYSTIPGRNNPHFRPFDPRVMPHKILYNAHKLYGGYNTQAVQSFDELRAYSPEYIASKQGAVEKSNIKEFIQTKVKDWITENPEKNFDMTTYDFQELYMKLFGKQVSDKNMRNHLKELQLTSKKSGDTRFWRINKHYFNKQKEKTSIIDELSNLEV